MRSALSTMLAGLGQLITHAAVLRTADEIHRSASRQAEEQLGCVHDSDMREAAFKATADVADKRRKARRAAIAAEMEAFRDALPDLVKVAQAELTTAARAVRGKVETVAPFPDLVR